MSRTRVGRALAGVAVCASLALATAGPADAAVDPRLTLEISSNPGYETHVAAGDTVAFTYTVSNDTGESLAMPENAGVEIVLKFDYDGEWPTVGDCDFDAWGFGEGWGASLLSFMYLLPAAMAPGQTASCTLSYTATAADVAYGGLWTTMLVEPDIDDIDVSWPPPWDYSFWYTVPAVGHSDQITIVGTPAVGRSLSVDPGLWGPWDPPFTYQWLRDDEPIPGATAATYRPTADDLGAVLTVRLTTQSSGITRTSLPSGLVTVAFTDVPESATFHDEIVWLASAGISTGYADGTYRRLSPVSREAMAAFLYRYAGSPAYTPPAVSPFSDVSTGATFYAEICWLADEGISTGYPDGTFRRLNAVSREAMAAFLYRFAESPAFTAPAVSPFSDVSTSATFYKEITWLADEGISTGYADGTFRRTAAVSREAMAAFLYRFDHEVQLR